MTEAKGLPSKTKLVIRFSIFAVVVALLVISVVFFSTRLDTPTNYTGGKVVGKLVPDLTLTTLEGNEVSLRSYTGKRVIVNFFNSWCGPCQEEEPALQEFARLHATDSDFVFIGIVRDDSESNIRKWKEGREVPFEIVLDPGEKAAIAFGTTGQPETYAIDRNGRVVASLLARATEQSLSQLWDATK